MNSFRKQIALAAFLMALSVALGAFGAHGLKQILSADWFKKATTPTNVNPEYGFMNYFLNTQQKMYPSAPASAYAHIGNGTNMIYVDEENDLVVVVRWIENNAIDNFLKKLLASLPNNK